MWEKHIRLLLLKRIKLAKQNKNIGTLIFKTKQNNTRKNKTCSPIKTGHRDVLNANSRKITPAKTWKTTHVARNAQNSAIVKNKNERFIQLNSVECF